MSASVTGLFVLVRHGDRQGFYQSPISYSAKQTNLTVAGYLQEYANGQDLRARYLNDTSELRIAGLNAQVHDGSRLKIIADAGGEGSVIVDSANALAQGLYPPYPESITLANGQNVTWDNRAQLIEIETVESDQSVSLEGWTECGAWQDRLQNWYTTDSFKGTAAQADHFYSSLDVLGSRPRTLQNAWNLFDFLNVEYIHNSTLAPQIGGEVVERAKYYADIHEAFAFAASDPRSIGNIAGQTFAATLLDDLARLANASDPLKMSIAAASYKPFLSLASLLNVNGDLSSSVVDYASTLLFELHSDDSLRVLFRNGSSGDWAALPLLGAQAGALLPRSQLESHLRPVTIESLAEWCDACGETTARGCGVLAALNGTGGAAYASPASTEGRQRVSPVVAGVIGALVALAVAAALLALWVWARGMPTYRHSGAVAGSKKRRRAATAHELASISSNAAPDSSQAELVKARRGR